MYRRHGEELSRDSHISRLRKELGENQQKLALLEEVSWLGYNFVLIMVFTKDCLMDAGIFGIQNP